jgi:hypothetical protein
MSFFSLSSKNPEVSAGVTNPSDPQSTTTSTSTSPPPSLPSSQAPQSSANDPSSGVVMPVGTSQGLVMTPSVSPILSSSPPIVDTPAPAISSLSGSLTLTSLSQDTTDSVTNPSQSVILPNAAYTSASDPIFTSPSPSSTQSTTSNTPIIPTAINVQTLQPSGTGAVPKFRDMSQYVVHGKVSLVSPVTPMR